MRLPRRNKTKSLAYLLLVRLPLLLLRLALNASVEEQVEAETEKPRQLMSRRRRLRYTVRVIPKLVKGNQYPINWNERDISRPFRNDNLQSINKMVNQKCP